MIFIFFFLEISSTAQQSPLPSPPPTIVQSTIQTTPITQAAIVTPGKNNKNPNCSLFSRLKLLFLFH